MLNDTNNHFWEDSRGAHVADVSESAWNAAVADDFSDYDESSKPYRNVLLDRTGLAIRTKLDALMTVAKRALTFFSENEEEAGVISASTIQDVSHQLNVTSDAINLSAVLPSSDGSYLDVDGEPIKEGYMGFDSEDYKANAIRNHTALVVADTDWTSAQDYRRATVDTYQTVEGNTIDGINDVLAGWNVVARYSKKDMGAPESTKHASLSLGAQDSGTQAGMAADKITLAGRIWLDKDMQLWESITNNLHILTTDTGTKDRAEFSIEKDGAIYSRTNHRDSTTDPWGTWTGWERIDAADLIKTAVQEIVIPSTSPGSNASGNANVVNDDDGYTPVGILDWWWKSGTKQNWFQNYGTHLESGKIHYRFLNNHATSNANGTLRVRVLYVRLPGIMQDPLATTSKSANDALGESYDEAEIK